MMFFFSYVTNFCIYYSRTLFIYNLYICFKERKKERKKSLAVTWSCYMRSTALGFTCCFFVVVVVVFVLCYEFMHLKKEKRKKSLAFTWSRCRRSTTPLRWGRGCVWRLPDEALLCVLFLNSSAKLLHFHRFLMYIFFSFVCFSSRISLWCDIVVLMEVCACGLDYLHCFSKAL